MSIDAIGGGNLMDLGVTPDPSGLDMLPANSSGGVVGDAVPLGQVADQPLSVIGFEAALMAAANLCEEVIAEMAHHQLSAQVLEVDAAVADDGETLRDDDQANALPVEMPIGQLPPALREMIERLSPMQFAEICSNLEMGEGLSPESLAAWKSWVAGTGGEDAGQVVHQPLDGSEQVAFPVTAADKAEADPVVRVVGRESDVVERLSAAILTAARSSGAQRRVDQKGSIVFPEPSAALLQKLPSAGLDDSSTDGLQPFTTQVPSPSLSARPNGLAEFATSFSSGLGAPVMAGTPETTGQGLSHLLRLSGEATLTGGSRTDQASVNNSGAVRGGVNSGDASATVPPLLVQRGQGLSVDAPVTPDPTLAPWANPVGESTNDEVTPSEQRSGDHITDEGRALRPDGAASVASIHYRQGEAGMQSRREGERRSEREANSFNQEVSIGWHGRRVVNEALTESNRSKEVAFRNVPLGANFEMGVSEGQGAGSEMVAFNLVQRSTGASRLGAVGNGPVGQVSGLERVAGEVWSRLSDAVARVRADRGALKVEIDLPRGLSVEVELRGGAAGVNAVFRVGDNGLRQSLESMWSVLPRNEKVSALDLAEVSFERGSSREFSDADSRGARQDAQRRGQERFEGDVRDFERRSSEKNRRLGTGEAIDQGQMASPYRGADPSASNRV